MIKIDKIKIKGFKKLKSTEVELFPNTNLLLGHNAQGKTAFLDAIRYALTDNIQDQAKGNFIEAVNDQCKTASVVITGQAGTMPFDIKRTLAKTNRSGPSPVQVGTQLGINPHILSACLNANYYFDLDPANQKKLIIKALGLRPTLKDAYVALYEKGYSSNVCQELWNEEIIKEISLFGWDAGYSIAYDLRRETGQRLKTLMGEQPKLITEVAMDSQQIPMDKIIEAHNKNPLPDQEEKHKKELKKLYKKLGGIQALSESDKKTAEAYLEKYQAEKAELVKAEKWTEEDTAEGTRLKAAKKKFNTKASKDLAALEDLLETTKNQLAENKEKWQSSLKCPIPNKSGHAMCPATEPNWFQQQEEVDNLGERIRKAEREKFPEQETWDALSEKAAICKDNVTRMKTLEKDILELEQKLENAKPEATGKKKALEDTIALLEKKVEHLRLGQSAITWNEATRKILDTIHIKIAEAETRHEHYSELCSILSPSGIPGELVAERLGALNDRLKEHAPMMGVSIQFLDDLSLTQGNKKQLWTLGGAETSRVRMAVAEAISHVTGVGLLLLDELNISVAADSARVRSWLVDIGQTTQIVAAAATNATEPPSMSEKSPVRVFWVENGKIEKL